MSKSIKRTLALAKRNLKELFRDPISLIFIFGLPLVMEILFYFLFHGKTSQFDMKYLAPGIVVFSQSFIALFVGFLLSIDRNTSFLTRLYVSKAKSHEFILSYALAIIPLSLMQSILFFIVGGIIDSSIFCAGMILGILLSLVTAILFIGLGILIGTLCNERAVGGVASIIITGQSLLSGMWFPVESVSGGMKVVMEVLPFRNATLLIQNMILGVNDTFDDFIKPLLIVIAYTIIVFVIAILLFKKKMKER
ncbi:MAG: ABC transporter permease [Acholeplasmatales bacterium]|nr:ABC transporter permease [Acholeplasmatales bacterium]